MLLIIYLLGILEFIYPACYLLSHAVQASVESLAKQLVFPITCNLRARWRPDHDDV